MQLLFHPDKICIAYELDGTQTINPPFTSEGYERAKPVYIEMSGWKTSTIGTKSFDALPKNAQDYIRKIEELTEVSIDIISTGPDRDETLVLKHPFN
jgi:adenylosuccinate synthase